MKSIIAHSTLYAGILVNYVIIKVLTAKMEGWGGNEIEI